MCSWLSRSCEIEEHSARFSRALPLAPLGPSSPGTTRRCESADWYTRKPERDEKNLPFPVKRGRGEGRGLHTSKCHPVQFTTQPSGPKRQQRLMKNGSHYEPDPSWFELLTPTSYSCDPPIAVSWPFNLPSTLIHGLMCPKHARVSFWCPRGTFRLIMGIAADSSVHFLN